MHELQRRIIPDNPATIYTNCTVVTVDPARPRAGAIATRGGTISAVGDLSHVKAAVGAGARIVDLAGASLLPGFDDCHMHILSFGLTLGQVDVRPTVASSILEIQRRLHDCSRSAPGEWILGRGYDQNQLAERRHPDRRDLDAVSSQRPVVLWHTSGHVMVANTRALERAGIAAGTADPPGGEIERDEDGAATGVIKETAMALLRRAVPAPSQAQAMEAIAAASAVLVQEGVTSASDAATGQTLGLEIEMAAYKGAFESGLLRTRTVLMPLSGQVLDGENWQPRLSPNDLDLNVDANWLSIGATKIFADGALTTRTAALRETYLDTGGRGLLTWDLQTLQRIMQVAVGAGWRIATHAIGDRAIDDVLTAYEGLVEGREPARHRIEHCTICDSAAIHRIRKIGVIPVLQPEDIAVLGDSYESGVDRWTAQNNSPVGWFENGVPIAFSSDRPVTPGHPLVGIQAAVERRTPSGTILGPEHRIGPERALRHYTLGGAFATCTERIKGSLEPGKKADFVVLDTDVTACPTHEIGSTRVLMTVVDGEVAFQA